MITSPNINQLNIDKYVNKYSRVEELLDAVANYLCTHLNTAEDIVILHEFPYKSQKKFKNLKNKLIKK
ncbi:hypothetical protein E5347_02385 [Clostridium sartagoforme]|uniref:Uncharacterized protein n=1 Tax=Clostridium sartagoforme TaxID=84031 RepID=A0A4S2DPF9_9CLOT|nr:hypothetical protein [Clostridium sartagoforme]TGY43682.1 hypothetical protein E5347_02385 [Clostridium sartagoforme]